MQIQDLEVVLKVAELGSITAAAKQLDMQTATASAAVKRVEAYIGAELFIRTTRQLRLSNVGERYIPQCQQALMGLDLAKQAVHQEQGIISGEVRVAVSSDLGRNLVMPWIDDFLEAHPQVSVRAHLSDSNIDFYRDALDIAVRYGAPPDSSLYGFKICDVPRVLCASPEYLRRHVEPQTPSELKHHNGLFYQLQNILNDTWQFYDEQGVYKVKPNSNRSANDGELVRRWCVAGKGIAVKSSLDIADDLLTGKLIPVMQNYQVTMGELWLIYPSRQTITPTIRLLRDMFRERTHALLSALIERELLSKEALS
ncbi:MAG: LysR family transcriptional regulator [Marinomonas gallaica]